MWNLTVETGENPCPFGYIFDENTGVFYFCAAKSCRELNLNLYADGRLAAFGWDFFFRWGRSPIPIPIRQTA